MELVRSIDVEEACRDINPSPAPPGIAQAAWDQSRARGRREVKDLAWYRGYQAGLHDAYLTLRKEHPRVAESFRKATGLEKNGDQVL